MELFVAVELFTQVITYVMIAAGVPPCVSMLRTKVTKGIPYPFFLAGTVNAVMGVGYGFLVDNVTFIQINSISITFNIFYIGSFLYTSKSKSKPLAQLWACGVFVAGVYFYVTRIVSPNRQMDNIGVIMLTASTLMLLTPLLQVKQCVDDKTGAYISVVMLGSGFLCCGSWLLYGYLLKDVYIYGPNVVGLGTYVCLASVIVMYGRSPPEKSTHAD